MQQLPTAIDPAYGNFTPTSWFEGSGWSWDNNAVGAPLGRVWAADDNDVWFVRGGPSALTVHFDGTSYDVAHLPTEKPLTAVWGASSTDIWTVGRSGAMLHWDGAQWTEVQSGTTLDFLSVSGTATDDVWAAGAKVMLHWDGTSWTPSPGFVPDNDDRFGASSVKAISRGDALVVTNYGCQRFDGQRWNATACGVHGGHGVYAAAPDDIWVVGDAWGSLGGWTAYRSHWDGKGWTATSVPGGAYGTIAGTSSADIWIDGTSHYDGVSWTDACGPRFTSLVATPSGDYIGIGSRGIQHAPASGWPFLLRSWTDINFLGGTSPTDVWAVGYTGTVLRYDGSAWAGHDYPRADSYIYGAFGSSSTDIWTIGPLGELSHFDGTGWSAGGIGQGVTAGFARSPVDAIAAGTNGRAWHWNGQVWEPASVFEGDRIVSMWGSGANDIWAVGYYPEQAENPTGIVWHWDGASWSRIFATNIGEIYAVSGTGPSDVWFLGKQFSSSSTTILHWDGSLVSIVDTTGSLRQVAAAGPGEAWFLTNEAGARLLHYANGAFVPEELSQSVSASSIWPVPSAGLFLSFYSGALYHRQ